MQERIFIAIVIFLIQIVFQQSFVKAEPIGAAIVKVADRLQEEQIKQGINAGSWTGEINFTGPIVAGIANACEVACKSEYLSAAELGANSILMISQGNFYGDEAFALTRLSMISTDPNDPWRDIVSDYYSKIKYSGGTQAYISNFYAIDPSIAVLYMSYHVLAAYYVDANDKKIWRQELINLLSSVDDSSVYPVMALGAAVWALSQTGTLDQTIINNSLEYGASYWNSKRLAELPDLLISHQVQDGQPNAGSFYWQFGHKEGSPSGYTEDAIFATLGLTAVFESNPDPNLYYAIGNSCSALLNGINMEDDENEGTVWERLSREGAEYCAYAGEMLQALRALIIPGDINLDGCVNFEDFEIFSNNWYAGDCAQQCWCNGADIDHNGIVDIEDFKVFLDNWLREMSFEENI
ncbi:MAG: hypothetical protein JW787_00760 [Sedimentisphaerales bacterium]|nr:hypothetical protein [Sedimentisphaerales bacterium]